MIKDVDDIRVSYNFFKNPSGQDLATAVKMVMFFIRAKRELGKNRVSFELNSIRVEPHTHLYNAAVDEGVIKKGCDLLFPTYYTYQRTKYIESLFNLLLKLIGK